MFMVPNYSSKSCRFRIHAKARRSSQSGAVADEGDFRLGKRRLGTGLMVLGK